MTKPIKLLLLGVGALIALALAGIAILAATFNPNDYKPQIVKLVQDKKQRTLTIPGDIRLTFFPKIGADLGKVSLSEHQGKAEFASVNSARVMLELLPLLRRQVVVDQVRIDGASINIVRHKDGTTNFDDLMAKQTDDPGQQIAFDIDSVAITGSRLAIDDRKEGRSVELSQLDLKTGRIANGVPSDLSMNASVRSSKPLVEARIALKSGFSLDLDKKVYAVKGADGSFNGKLDDFSNLAIKITGNANLQPDAKRFLLDGVKLSVAGKRAAQAIDAKFDAPKLSITDASVTGGKLSGEVKLTEAARTITAVLSAPSFEGSPQSFKLPGLAVDTTIKDTGLDARASLNGAFSGNIDELLFNSPQIKLTLAGKQGGNAIDGSMTTPLNVNLKTQRIDLPKIAAAFTLPNPGGGTLKFTADGNASANLDKQTMAAQLKGKLDESNFSAKLGMSDFTPAAYTFDLEVDNLDADRYQAKTPSGKEPAAASKAPTPAPASGAEKPIDLSGLKDLRATGTVRIGALKTQNIKISNLRADVRAGGGKLELSPLSAALYGGTANGAVSATTSAAPKFSLRQNLAGIRVGNLLKDALGKEPIDGSGNVSIDITTEGALVSQIKKNLNGTARLALRDGAVHGINVAQAIRKAKSQIGALRGDAANQAGSGSANEKTDFSELTASFRIAAGVARNEDLSLKSPLLRVEGAGTVDLPAEKLDYLVKATVVSTLQGQGGPELQSLKGITIPVRLAGPFTAIGWSVDFKGLATEAAKQKVEEKKEEVRSQAKEAIDAQRGKLQDRLKGMFGK